MSNVSFVMRNENEEDNFRPETTDILLDNDEEDMSHSNTSNTSLSSFVNKVEGMDCEVRKQATSELCTYISYTKSMESVYYIRYIDTKLFNR